MRLPKHIEVTGYEVKGTNITIVPAYGDQWQVKYKDGVLVEHKEQDGITLVFEYWHRDMGKEESLDLYARSSTDLATAMARALAVSRKCGLIPNDDDNKQED